MSWGRSRMPGWQDRRPGARVLPWLDDVLAGGDRSHDLDRGVIQLLCVLNHDHRVCAARQHPAREGDGSLAVENADLGRSAHRHLADDVEIGRQALRSAERVRGTDRVAVHGRAREGREIFRRYDGGAGHAPHGVGGGQTLRLHLGHAAVVQGTERSVGRQDVEELRHGAPSIVRLPIIAAARGRPSGVARLPTGLGAAAAAAG